MNPSIIEAAVTKLVDERIAQFNNHFLRRHGGVPIDCNSEMYKRAVEEINHLIKSGTKKPSQQSMGAALDLLGVLHACKLPETEISVTLGLLASLAQGAVLSDLTENDRWITVKEGLQANSRDQRVVRKGDQFYFTEGWLYPTDDKPEGILKGEASWVEIKLPISVTQLTSKLYVNEDKQEENSA